VRLKKVKNNLNRDDYKYNLGVFFTAPAGGEVTSINRGEKRKFLSI
jgi:Na+-transporting NADH:ubiquinone oxidoreductase subunit NqrA